MQLMVLIYKFSQIADTEETENRHYKLNELLNQNLCLSFVVCIQTFQCKFLFGYGNECQIR